LFLGGTTLEAQSIIEAPAAPLSASDLQKLGDRYTAYDAFFLHPTTVWAEAMNQGGDEVELKLDLPDGQLWLQLKKSSIYAPLAMSSISTATNQEWEYLNGCEVYRGYVDGDEANFAIFMIRQDKFLGYYLKNDKLWTINNLEGEGIDSEIPNQNTFVRYVDPKITELFTCGTETSSNTQVTYLPPIATERMPFFLEIAYDVDSSMFAKIRTQLGVNATQQQAKAATEEFLVGVTMRIEAIYKVLVPTLTFHVAHINIWVSDYYKAQTSLLGHLNKGKGYWENNLNCINRDVVSILSNKYSDVGGVTSSNGVNTICGGTYDPASQCTALPYHAAKFYQSISEEGVLRTAHTVSHELVHNFGQEIHSDTCGHLMFDPSTSQCNLPGEGWDAVSIGYITNFFADNQVYERCIRISDNAPPVNLPATNCLRSLSASNNISQGSPLVTLSPNKSFYCAGDLFQASWFDQSGPSNNNDLTWEYDPYLQEVGIQPNNKKRNLEIIANLPTYAYETWIKVTFKPPFCNIEPVTFILKIKLNSSFNMDATYVSTQVPVTTVVEYINVIPSGTYTLSLTNSPSSTNHVWEELQNNGTYTVLTQWVSNWMDFTMPYYPSTGTMKTFRVSVPNGCGTANLVRNIYFSSVVNPWGLVSPGGNGSVVPNPSNGVFSIRLDAPESLENEAIQIQRTNVFDNTGKLIVTMDGNGINRQEIDLRNFPDGVYHAFVITNAYFEQYQLVKISNR
jgi:Secretion system C-terminal sorting domain